MVIFMALCYDTFAVRLLSAEKECAYTKEDETMSYLICSDASMDVDLTKIHSEEIAFIPMEYTVGDEVRTSVGPESAEMMHDYYEKLRKKLPTRTSQISFVNYMEYFRTFAENKQGVLCLCLSSGLSSTYDSACLAVKTLLEDYPDAQIEVVDTLGATGGMGLLFESAIENRTNGMSLSQNAAWLREAAKNVVYWFKVEDLMYLKRGGRVSAATAVVGTALNIKPILTILGNGRLESVVNKRGNRLALREMVTRFEDGFDTNYGTKVYICCGDCMDVAEEFAKEILAARPEAEIRITELSPIIGAHTGPDMLAVIYFGNNRMQAE